MEAFHFDTRQIQHRHQSTASQCGIIFIAIEMSLNNATFRSQNSSSSTAFGLHMQAEFVADIAR